MHATMLAELILLGLVFGVDPDQNLGAELELTPQTRFVLASRDLGREVLTQDDNFSRSLSRFDLECRLQTVDRATRDAWKAMVSEQVRPWETADQQRLQVVVGRLKEKLVRFNLPFPKQVLLVHTTGNEEGNAAYCRGAAIVLPVKVIALSDDKLERLIVHELFHVLSNQNPKLRTRLYATIGFYVMPPLELPLDLRDRKITNPDAPLIDCWIALEHAGKKLLAAPVLYASAERYNPSSKRSFFDYLTFRLMVLQEENGAYSPALTGGEPTLLDPRTDASYLAQIGRNTNYIIHPDEILADNFAHLVLGGQQLATPRIVEEMRQILSK